MMPGQSLQIWMFAVAGWTCLVAQFVEGICQLVMAGDKLLELLVTDIAQLERADGGSQPVGQRGRFLDGPEGGLRGMEALHHNAAYDLHDGLGAVDARIVILLRSEERR